MESLEEMLKRTIESIKSATGSEEVIGKPVATLDGSIVLPVNKVSCGFVVGGGEYGNKPKDSDYPYSAASGGGVTVTPIGFLVCGREKRFIGVDGKGDGKWFDLLSTLANTLGGE